MNESDKHKYKNMMYTQQLKYLPAKTVDTLIDMIENLNPAPKKYAVIVHDKDIDDNGNPEEPHVHAMLSFENARSLNNVASLLNDKPQYIEAWTRKEGNGFAYLVHATKNARKKYQYNSNEVKSNFDYFEELLKISNEVEKSKQQANINLMLDALYEGTISKAEVEERLSGSQYGRFHRQIEDVYAKRLQNLSLQWKKEMMAQGKKVKVIWIYGTSGTGKTSLALDYAKKANQKYFVSGSSRDIFQNYSGEHTLILDELRGNSLPYQDLLRVTDPFGIHSQVMAPSRYNDKALACDLIIITTPFNPLEFYREVFGDERDIPKHLRKNNRDSFDQLLRRISLIVEINQFWINAVEYDAKSMTFNHVANAKRKNTYFNPNQLAVTNETVDLFNSMFD